MHSNGFTRITSHWLFEVKIQKFIEDKKTKIENPVFVR